MIGWILLAALAVFVAVVAVRTAAFRPKPQPQLFTETHSFDKEAAVDALAQLVRCKTVSYNDPALEDDAEFDRLISLLPTLCCPPAASGLPCPPVPPVPGGAEDGLHSSRCSLFR